MATKARQQYFADEDSLQKIRREFSIADDIQQKIDSIEPGAQVNKIETVKVNGTALVPDANKAVNVEVPEVIDNLYTVDSDNALSAKQGKLLYDYIQNIASRGRFLSNWNSATGLPMTNPSENPYPYKSGDYFIVSNVAGLGGTNYRPDGSSYIIGQASTVVETDSVDVSDFYFYDGTNWLLLKNSGRSGAVDSSLSTTSTNPVENRVITNALNNKQDILTAGNHIDITNNVISAEGFQEELTAGDNITIEDVCATESDMQGPAPSGFHVPLTTEWQAVYDIWTALGGGSSDGTNFGIALKLPFAGGRSYSSADVYDQGTNGRYWSSSRYNANTAYHIRLYLYGLYPQSNNYRANGFSVRCFKDTPTIPTSSWTKLYGTSIEAGGIFWSSADGLISLSSDGTDWITIQDKNLGATTVYNDGDTLSEANCGYYYQRGNNYSFPRTGTIANQSTTQVDASNYGPGNYYSSDTFIKYYGRWDSTDNGNLWGGVTQQSTQSCSTVISSTDTTYTAGTGISIDANNVISSTATSAQWGNITGTLSNQTDLQNALDSKVNLGMNKVFDSTVVEIGKWEHEPGGDSSGHHIELDPSGEVSTYNLTQAGHNEATLGSGTLELLNNTVLDGNKTATFDHEKIVADDGTNTNTYNFFGNDRIAKLSDLSGKQDTLTASTGISIDSSNNISNTLPGPTIAATAPTGTEGALWYDTTNNVLMAHDGTSWKEAGTQMKVLSYGHSTWQDFIDAYNENAIVYCRASSNSNPGSGNQGRMAFMAFVSINNTTGLPTEVEFQYYRSRSDHNTAANQLDQVFVYKLTSASGGTWTVTERNTGAKAVAGTGINLAFAAPGNMTISADTTVLATKTDLNSKQDTLVSGTNIKTINSNSLLGSGNLTLNDVKVSATAPASPTEGMVWYDTTNDQLKVYDGTNWQVTGKEYNAGPGISIGQYQDYSAMRGPCPEGFHVPMIEEWRGLIGTLATVLSTGPDGVAMKTYLKMPLAGFRNFPGGGEDSQGSIGNYWTSTKRLGVNVWCIAFDASSTPVNLQNYSSSRTYGYSVRGFKDSPIIPDNSWTILYDGSSIATGAGVFHNAALGLISVSGDGTTWYTIQDKNLGATIVYNDGATLSEANCGKYYQRGNNYGFPRTGTMTMSSTKVDASGYGPGNYYSSDTFITGSGDWSSVRNDNLRGGVTGVVTLNNAITNTGVLSVNGQTGDVTINAGEASSIATTQPSNPVEGDVYYDTTNDQLKVYDGTNWNVTGKEYNAGPGIEINNNSISAKAGTGIVVGDGSTDYSAMRGPCPNGYHIPLHTEHQDLVNMWTALGFGTSSGIDFVTYFHTPTSCSRWSNGNNQGFSEVAISWSANKAPDGFYVLSAYADPAYPSENYVETDYMMGLHESFGHPIRAFKDVPVIPDSNWTTVYQGTGSAGIYYNSTLGLISVSSDGTNWITLKDKNEGATTVWNYGDALSAANVGNVYQRGNNYGFPRTGTITTSITQVDASSYGPGNYYSSSTFITTTPYRDSSENRNLRGGVTGIVVHPNGITNTGVLSVNGQAGAVTINEFNPGGTATTGYVVTKTANGYQWQAPTGGLQVAPNSPITGIKYVWYGTEADYNNLSQYYTDTPGDTEFRCF